MVCIIQTNFTSGLSCGSLLMVIVIGTIVMVLVNYSKHLNNNKESNAAGTKKTNLLSVFSSTNLIAAQIPQKMNKIMVNMISTATPVAP